MAYKEGQNFQGALADMLGLEAADAGPGAIMEALVALISTCSELMEDSLQPDAPKASAPVLPNLLRFHEAALLLQALLAVDKPSDCPGHLFCCAPWEATCSKEAGILPQEAAQLAATSAACEAGQQGADRLPVSAALQRDDGQHEGPSLGNKDAGTLQAYAAAGSEDAQPVNAGIGAVDGSHLSDAA